MGTKLNEIGMKLDELGTELDEIGTQFDEIGTTLDESETKLDSIHYKEGSHRQTHNIRRRMTWISISLVSMYVLKHPVNVP